jgi:hypothetical protein
VPEGCGEEPHIDGRATGHVAKEMRRRRESYVDVFKRNRTLMVDKDGKGEEEATAVQLP